MIKNVICVIDGAAGSCGKAKVVGELATDRSLKIGASVTNCMPNAGHTFVDEEGNKTVFRNIPVAIINPDCELFIGPGSAIDMDVFKEEYEQALKYLNNRKIYVHELVPLIKERHKDLEKKVIKSGSTYKGGNGVTAEKIMRYPELEFFETYKNAIRVPHQEWVNRLHEHLDREDEYVILEGSQGCDLSLNSDNYPYTTCRDISVSALFNDSKIPIEAHLETIMVIRPFPIRISNITKEGNFIYTGNYGTGEELTWTQINIASLYGGYPFKGDILSFPSHLSESYLKKLLSHTPEVYLKQLFGLDYRLKKIQDISLLEALELERLRNKAKGSREYVTKILELGMIKADLLPNTIIDQSEQTTVTKMERRIFDLDIAKLKLNCKINNPYGLYLNFFQHLGYEYTKTKGNIKDFLFNRYIEEYLNFLETETNTPLLALGTGAKNQERILIRSLVKK